MYISNRDMFRGLSELHGAINLLSQLLSNLGLDSSPVKGKLWIIKKIPLWRCLVLKMNRSLTEIVHNVK